MVNPMLAVPSVLDMVNANTDRQYKQNALESEILGQVLQNRARMAMAQAAQQEMAMKQQEAHRAMQAREEYARTLDPSQVPLFGMAPQEYVKSQIDVSKPRWESTFNEQGREVKGWVTPQEFRQVGGYKQDVPNEAEIAGAARKAGAIEGAQFPFKRATAAAGASNISFAPQLAKEVPKAVLDRYGSMLEESYNQAKSAVNGVQDADRLLNIAKTGKYLVGPGSSTAQQALRFGQAFGVQGKDDKELLQNTKELEMQLAKNAATARSTLMKDPQISKADLDFLDKLSGGSDITKMSQPELIRLGELMKYSSQRQYQLHQQRLAKLRSLDINSPNPMGEMAGLWEAPEANVQPPALSAPAQQQTQPGLPPGFKRVK